jgi:hypothetical protein
MCQLILIGNVLLIVITGRRRSSAVVFSERGPSDIDNRIRLASSLPGVGQYNISLSPLALHRQGSGLSKDGSDGASNDNNSANGSRVSTALSSPSPVIAPSQRMSMSKRTSVFFHSSEDAPFGAVLSPPLRERNNRNSISPSETSRASTRVSFEVTSTM